MSPSDPRLQRLLPDRWQGPSREARWRRARAAKFSAAGLAAVSTVLVVQALTPDAATTTVAVAARDLPAGTALRGSDLKSATWPRGAALPGALSATAAVGKVLTSAVSADEPLTSTRVRAARGWPATGLRTGETTVIPVPVAAVEVAEQVHEGDQIDIYGPSGDRVGSALRVVGRTTPARQGATSVVFVAATSTGASSIARALSSQPEQSGPLTIGLHISS